MVQLGDVSGIAWQTSSHTFIHTLVRSSMCPAKEIAGNYVPTLTPVQAALPRIIACFSQTECRWIHLSSANMLFLTPIHLHL